MKQCISMMMILMLCTMSGGVVRAQQSVLIEVDPVCCEKRIEVYGDEQPTFFDDDCLVPVTIDVVDESEAEIQSSPDTDPVDIPQGPSFPTGLSTAFISLPLIPIVFPLSALKQGYDVLQPVLEQGYEVLEQQFKKIFTSTTPDFVQKHAKDYHFSLDELFASSIRMVSEYESADDLSKKLATYEGECRGDNPSPRCLAERAFCSHEKYGRFLFEVSGQSLVEDAAATQDLSRYLEALEARDQSLVEEASQSQQALETALAVYDQFYQTYRLHLRFKEVVEALVKVKTWTGHLRTLVGCFPNKFIGVATTKCN